MYKNIMIILLFGTLLLAQTFNQVNITAPDKEVGPAYLNGKPAFVDVNIFYNGKHDYLFMQSGDTIMVAVIDTNFIEGRKSFDEYDVTVNTERSEKSVSLIKILSKFPPIVQDIVTGNGVVVRYFRGSNPKVYFIDLTQGMINNFPQKINFKCVDKGKRPNDTLEYRLFIKGSKAAKNIGGYKSREWTPWMNGESGEILIDSLEFHGKYTIKVQSRNNYANTKYEKEIEFKY